MADHLRPMEELLRIPIVGIEDAIVVPAVLADQFELKPELLDFVSNNSFFGLANDDPHSHIRRFYQITQTLRLNQVPDNVVKLILFPFSLKGAVETWLENEPPNSITSWDDLETLNQLMQNQMGQMEEIFQERQSCVLPSNTDQCAELNVITSTDGLTLDGSFLPHSNSLVYQEKEQEPETITEVVEIPSSQSTPLVPPQKTPSLSAPKPKEDLKPNPYQPPISYPCRLQEENFHALENPTGRVDHFVYRIDIFDSLCDSFPIENNSLSDSSTLSPDPVVESLSHSLTPVGEIDLLLEETDAFLSLDDSIPPDLPPKELKDDEPSTTKSLIEKPLEIDNEIYDSEGDIIFLENLLKDEPSEVVKSEIYTRIGEPSDTFLMEDEEIKLNPLKDNDDSVPIPRNEHCDEPKTETIMDEVYSTVQIPPLFEELTSGKSMQDIILHRIRHGMVNSSRLSFYLNLFSFEDNFESLSSNSFELGDQNVVFDPGILLNNGIFSFPRKSPHLLSNNFMFDKSHILIEISLMIESSVSFHPKDKEIRGESS
ncbi:hypothetical protein Tco_1272171 [Tanacetum coccineum]